jgi:hypothetical protein
MLQPSPDFRMCDVIVHEVKYPRDKGPAGVGSTGSLEVYASLFAVGR